MGRAAARAGRGRVPRAGTPAVHRRRCASPAAQIDGRTKFEQSFEVKPGDVLQVEEDHLGIGVHACPQLLWAEQIVETVPWLRERVESLSPDEIATIAEHDMVLSPLTTYTCGRRRRRIVEGETKVSKLPSWRRWCARRWTSVALRADEDRRPGELPRWCAPRSTSPPRSSSTRGTRCEQVENLRSMFIAMAEDWRIVVVKLADRLHNMRTLQYMPVEKRVAIARETLEIFAPLAHRLGMWQFKTELADLAFKYLFPQRSTRSSTTRTSTSKIRRHTSASCSRRRGQQQLEYQDESRGRGGGLLQADPAGRVRAVGRRPGAPSRSTRPWKKMQRRECGIERINDLVALRVVLDPEVEDEGRGARPIAEGDENAICYHVLGKVHSLWTPLPRTLKDYISSAQAQRLPLAAHDGPRRHAAARGADPHRADAPRSPSTARRRTGRSAGYELHNGDIVDIDVDAQPLVEEEDASPQARAAVRRRAGGDAARFGGGHHRHGAACGRKGVWRVPSAPGDTVVGAVDAGSSRAPCTAPAATAASSHGSSAADAPSPPERTPGHARTARAAAPPARRRAAARLRLL